MMVPIIFFAAFFLLAFAAWCFQTYNRFIKYRNNIEEAWSSIDVALKRRFNLVPNLIRVIEGYSQHEAKLLGAAGEALPRTNAKARRAEEESRISRSLTGLLALAEAYPDLKASANFAALQNTLDEVEEDIQKARNRYNRYVGKLNTLVESFPAALIARKFGFEKQNYFTLDLATQREMPAVDFSTSRADRG
ncbi:MAG: LemA family protein [Desulfobacteraceae bacterium]|jgi:LemA protein